ncbi:hypothetical protein MOTT16_01820 [Moraxella osloensis]|jgi:hypothetical protein|uniref:Uncharacterized protein n=1 Tax=Faucicola osloensis TaxID=34062 RepID=A0AAD0AD70_FAUOS|nr:hypothetical protein [Moraxella osloensis]ATQ82672.1 hypothetical protein YHS_01825 [Moraxella osloensis]ATW85173.1 hypothetical protein MOTT16_01820 [Moraxella osloensis]
MALAKYYEEILERLHNNAKSINYLIKPENRWLITDERWGQISANLKTQLEKAERICKELSNKDLLQLKNEIDSLKLENLELRESIDNQGVIKNKNYFFKNLSIENAVVFRHKVKDGFSEILVEDYDNELIVNHKDFPDIIDYLEGTILDIAIDIIGNVFAVKISDKTEIGKFAKFTIGKLKKFHKDNHAVIKSHSKVYVPQWVCENFYESNKIYKVYYLAVRKAISDEEGKNYDTVALQIFVIED